MTASSLEGRSQAGGALVLAVFVAAISGLVYELVAGAVSSYLLGDSVTQFSLVIGLFLTAMGVGSWLSKFLEGDLVPWFLGVEIAVGVLGGFTALIGFVAFATTELFAPVLLGCVFGVGTLVGLEVPIVVRLLRDLESLPVSLANVLSADYLGALVASVAFPFALLPHLGLVRAGLVAGLANVAVAVLVLWKMPPRRHGRALRLAAATASFVLIAGLASAGWLVSALEARLYQDEIVFTKTTAHQRVVVTRWRDDTRLYLDGHLQFSTIDEYRYHEALVHPAMGLAERRARVLVLGGGDGLAAREVYRHADVEHLDLVDLDRVVTDLFTDRELLASIGRHSLADPRTTIHNVDAFGFLRETTALWDVILMDLPDPSDVRIAKLYTTAFYGLAARHLAEGGVIAVQATSPFRSREAFWSIVATLEAVDLEVAPYHTVVPTFGTWGFAVAARELPPITAVRLPPGLRYLDAEVLPALFVFPADMAALDVPPSTLDDPAVVDLYQRGYHRYLE